MRSLSDCNLNNYRTMNPRDHILYLISKKDKLVKNTILILIY